MFDSEGSTYQPRRVSLNGLNVPLGEKGVDDQVLALRVVEEHKERPVKKPRTLLKLRVRVRVRVGVRVSHVRR